MSLATVVVTAGAVSVVPGLVGAIPLAETSIGVFVSTFV